MTEKWPANVLVLHRDALRGLSAALHAAVRGAVAQGASMDDLTPLVVLRAHVDAAALDLEAALREWQAAQSNQQEDV